MEQARPVGHSHGKAPWLWIDTRNEITRFGQTMFGGIALACLVGLVLGLAALVSPLLAAGLSVLFLVLVGVLMRPVMLCWLVAASIVLTSGIERGRFFPVLSGNEVALLGALSIAILVVVTDAKRSVSLPGYYWQAMFVLVGGVVMAPISIFLLMGTHVTLNNAFKMFALLQYFLLFWLFAAIPQNERERRTILVWMLLLGALVATVGVLQGMGVGIVQQLLNTVYTSSHEAMAARAGRITSLLGSWNSLGMFMMTILLMGWALLPELESSKQRYMLITVMAVCALCLLASGSFAGILGLMVGIFILQLLSRRKAQSLGMLIAGFMGVLLAVLVAYPILQPLIETRFAYQFDGSGWIPHTLLYRFKIWTGIFIPAIEQHFPLPVYPTVPEYYAWQFEESQYILLLFRTGLVGFLGYMAWIVLTLRWLYRRHRISDGITRAITAVAFAIVCVLVIAGFTNEVFSFSGTVDYLWILLALIANSKAGQT